MELPLHCEADYYPEFLTREESDVLFNAIRASCDLSSTRIKAGDGKTYTLDTGKCMFVDAPLLDQAKLTEAFGPRQLWLPELLSIKQRIESVTGRRYNVAVCIYYPDGNAGVGFHSDLVAYGDTSSIATLSLGQARAFAFRSVDSPDDSYQLCLSNGSLLIMGEHCQERYEHSLPIVPECTRPRINLTFRAYGWNSAE
ncbi:MAG: alpha-ketoglutarate-dependent dioxygenase AlkB [Gammaproteobacteria bacterium]|nr:alpha-ketoglutarate-dependent dioxygenase AlkB [Gammaproteobacteria bacterium]